MIKAVTTKKFTASKTESLAEMDEMIDSITVFLADTECPVLGTPISGRKHGSRYNKGDIVKFQCKPGFVLKGSAIRKCMENGTWNGTETICKGIKETSQRANLNFQLICSGL